MTSRLYKAIRLLSKVSIPPSLRTSFRQKRPIVFVRDQFGSLITPLSLIEWRYFATNLRFFDDPLLIDTLEKMSPPWKTVVDIGANKGVFSMWAAKRAHKVIAFEPASHILPILKDTVAANSLTNVECLPWAISNKDGSAKLFLHEGQGHHSLGEVKTSPTIGEQEVRTRTLDTLCREIGVDEIDLLKVDTEGFELEVFQGAENLLRQKKVKTLVFEVSAGPLSDLSKNASTLVKFLTSLGYQVTDNQKRKITPEESNKIFFGNLIAFPA